LPAVLQAATKARAGSLESGRVIEGLRGAGLLVDKPGEREVGLIDEDGLSAVIPGVEALLSQWRWWDCQHEGDGGCALEFAVESGELDPDRLAAWRSLQKEAAHEARRSEAALQRAEEKAWRQLHLAAAPPRGSSTSRRRCATRCSARTGAEAEGREPAAAQKFGSAKTFG
jgi:hypothetical protein